MTEISIQCRPANDLERNETVTRLREHTEAAVGMPVNHVPFGLLAYDGEQLVGSIIGKIFFHWLHLDLIWVAEGYRKKGIGTHLMALTGEKAKEMNLAGIELWTQSWQAPAFYRKIGYEELAVLDDFSPGHKRYVFRRHLKRILAEFSAPPRGAA